jgi:hypothetical protein
MAESFFTLSLILPAHNEEAVIARGRRAILTDGAPDVLDVALRDFSPWRVID